MNIDLNPNDIEPLHQPDRPLFLKELTKDMSRNGWNGRPLLIFEDDDGYVAWTGSHRIAAAIEADLALVPCYVLDASLLVSFGVSA